MAARILIADDHPVLRAGLRALIGDEPGFRIVGEATDWDEMMRMAANLQPDVVILDLGMPGCGGTAGTERWVEVQPDICVLVLTASEEMSMMDAALQTGAMGFVAKRVAEPELSTAIHAVTLGDSYDHSSTTPGATPGAESFDSSAPSFGAPDSQMERLPDWTCVEALTPREIDVLRLVALGYTNPQMASELRISVRTVETHREGLMAKLGMHTRVELVRYALEQGLLEMVAAG